MSVTEVNSQVLSEKNFDSYTTASGLSHNGITGIVQDSTGYVWIATSYGMNRFNGTRFLQYHSNSDSLSLAAEDISGISWIDNHRIGVFTSGLHIIDTRTGCSRNLFIPYHDRQYQYKFNMIERAMGDEKGNLYVLTRSGFYHYDKNYNLVSRFDYYSEAEVPVTHFFFGRELFQLDAKRLLIVSINGLYVYDRIKRKIKKMTAADCPVMAEFLDYPLTYYTFFQNKPGSFFILKSKSDNLTYVNVNENRKIVSKLPFNPGEFEFHWRSRLIKESDTTFYV
ncbi:MAG: two-component regulator propeller domain-containing protein, partial [Flavisolibacter sp.]